jgi:hypothetical protein
MPGDFKVPNYTVYFDTNTAYSKRPSDPVSPKIIKSIESARKVTTVDVRVPEVVFEELIYQQFKIASSAVENLQKNSETLRVVCGRSALEAPTSDTIEAGIRAQFDRLCDEHSISKLETPYEKIDWKSVVSDSSWRRSPFEKPKSEDDLAEKGFRDRMILETVKHDVATIENGVIVFISADNLLRASFENQVTSNCSIEVYSEFDEFVGHLGLLAKTKSEQHTKEVLAKVSKVFYDPEDPNCVVLSQGVLQHLTDEYAEDMTRPPILQLGSPNYPQTAKAFSSSTQPSAATSIRYGDWIEERKHWVPVSDLKFLPSSHVFQSGFGDGRYHWKSTITLARLLRRTVPQLRRPYFLTTEAIRTKDVDVLWSCLIDPHTAEFSDPKVEEYRTGLFSDSFVDADWSTRTAYGFPMFPGVDDNG